MLSLCRRVTVGTFDTPHYSSMDLADSDDSDVGADAHRMEIASWYFPLSAVPGSFRKPIRRCRADAKESPAADVDSITVYRLVSTRSLVLLNDQLEQQRPSQPFPATPFTVMWS